jgi:hypothetical protein
VCDRFVCPPGKNVFQWERTQLAEGKKKDFFHFFERSPLCVRAKEEEKDYGIRPKNIVAMQDWN